MEQVKISSFSGDQFARGEKEWQNHRYQYSYTSHEEQMDPALILYPKNDEDIKAAIRYAKEHNIAIAVRTGGHQYSGASSTRGKNIQLDMSNTFRGPDDFKISYPDGEKARPHVRVGISFALADVNLKLRDNHIFLPHGQCSHVHLGGHCQTGGYGQLGRSFGLFGDHIIAIRIITADGEVREIKRGEGSQDDKDLFFGVLGGSPGNFGVVTHLTLHPHRDDAHPKARGYKVLFPYTKERNQKFLEILADMSNDEDFPGDFDYCLTMLSTQYERKLAGWVPFLGKADTDETNRIDNKDDYGTGYLTGIDGLYPASILLYVQWANLGGADQDHKPALDFFKKIKKAGGVSIQTPCDYKDPKPMSLLTREWIFFNVREFDYPYEKRTYMASGKVSKDWPKICAERIDLVETKFAKKLFLSVQIQPFGGKNSAFRKNANKETSYSWRDSTISFVIDCFHLPDNHYTYHAQEYQRQNDKLFIGDHSSFTKQDRRVLWGSYGSLNLNNVWNTYHETREKYDRLINIKTKHDPHHIFTPNAFCIGVTPYDKDSQPAPAQESFLDKIEDVGHDTAVTVAAPVIDLGKKLMHFGEELTGSHIDLFKKEIVNKIDTPDSRGVANHRVFTRDGK